MKEKTVTRRERNDAMKKRIFFAILVMILTLALLASCKVKPNKNEGGNSTDTGKVEAGVIFKPGLDIAVVKSKENTELESYREAFAGAENTSVPAEENKETETDPESEDTDDGNNT